MELPATPTFDVATAPFRVMQHFVTFTPSELAHLVTRAGFRVGDMFGGFDRRALDDDAPEIIVVASVSP